jgi:hypothetical protein
MSHCCNISTHTRFHSSSQYLAFENELDQLIYNSNITQVIESDYKGVSYLGYQCIHCRTIWWLSQPDQAWRGFFLIQHDAQKHIDSIKHNDKKTLYTGIAIIVFVALCVVLLLSSCQHASQKHKAAIQASFKNWRNGQIAMGNYWAEDSCNMQYFANMPFDSMSVIRSSVLSNPIGIPDSSEIKFLYGDINNDGILDGIATFVPVQCDGGNFYKQEDEVLFLANKDAYYSYKLYLPMMTMPKNASSYHYSIDSFKDGTIYATNYGYTNDDGYCCPSIILHQTIPFDSIRHILSPPLH